MGTPVRTDHVTKIHVLGHYASTRAILKEAGFEDIVPTLTLDGADTDEYLLHLG